MNATNTRAKQALRRALRQHQGWDAYRTETGVNLGSMTMEDLHAAYAVLYGRAFDSSAAPDASADELSDDDAADVLAEDDDDAALAQVARLLADMRRKKASAITEAKVIELIKQHSAGGLVVTLKKSDGTEWRSETVAHPLFPRLLTALGSRMASGIAPNVWIAGPTGSGKTHAAEMAAKALGVPFFFNGALAMSFELVGFVDGAGNYHRTPFREAFEHGGLYLFDEADAWDNAALLALNAALANGVCAFPDNPAPIKRHADFICIGAANTFGHGATAEYIGRTKIDAAFLSRFPVRLHWTYDPALEQSISGNVAWAKRVQAARARAEAAGVKVVIDPRQSMAGAALLAAGISEKETAEMTYLAGLTPDQRKIVEGA